MPTSIRNRTRLSFPLPRPLMGFLGPGQGIVVPLSFVELHSSFDELIDVCDLEELPEGTPVEMRRVAAWPWREAFGLDGSTPNFSLTLAPAGHSPGYYFVNRLMMKRVGATAGNLALSVTWNDPRAGNQNFQNAVLSLVSAGPIPLGQGITINSSGKEPIIVSGVLSSITGSPILDASAQVELSQHV